MLEFDGKDAFEDRVNIVLEELSLGIKWERPCIILVVYRSEHIKNLVQAILSKSLGESVKAVLHYAVDKQHFDIPLELLDHPGHEQAIFFVSGLSRGGGKRYSNAYRALNMHREYLVEGKIKALFWLSKNEAKQITRFSPDFWAFRHKVIEFLDLPSIINNKPLELSISSFHDLYTKNAKDLTDWINTAEMFYSLGCIDDAVLNFRKALRKYPDQSVISLQIAEIHLLTGRLPSAVRILNKANRRRTEKVPFLKELDRLNQIANSIQPTRGGFMEQIT